MPLKLFKIQSSEEMRDSQKKSFVNAKKISSV